MNRFLDGYRATAAFWHATTRFTDGDELTAARRPASTSTPSPAARPGHYRDLGCAIRVAATPLIPLNRPVDVKLGQASSWTAMERCAPTGYTPHARLGTLVAGGEPVCVVSSGAIALACRSSASDGAALDGPAAGGIRARSGEAPGRWEEALGADGIPRPRSCARRVTWPTAPPT